MYGPSKAKDQKNCCLSTSSSSSTMLPSEFKSFKTPKVHQMQLTRRVTLHGAILPPIEQYHLTTATRKKRWSMMSFKFQNILPKLQHITHLYRFNIWNHALNHSIIPSSTGTSLVQPRCHLKNIVANFEGKCALSHPPWQLTLNCPLGHAPSAGAKRCEWLRIDGCNDVDPL